MNFYVASYGSLKEVYLCSIDKKGNIKNKLSVRLEGYPSYIHKYGKHISISLKKVKENEKGGLVICQKNNLDVAYKYLEDISYTHIYEDSKYIILASYHQGLIKVINKKNNKQNVSKYKNGKIHQVGRINENKYFGVDLENSNIYIFKICNDQIQLLQTISLDEKINPRHLISYKNGKLLYVAIENTSEVLVYVLEKDKYKKIQTISTVLKENKNNMVAAIRRNKKYVFVSNRGEDTISIYKIQKKGILKLVKCLDVNGKCPRDFNICNNGKILIVANEQSNQINSFLIDYKTFKITLKGLSNIQQPVCIEI